MTNEAQRSEESGLTDLLSAMQIALNNKDVLTVNILRQWSREEIERFALHLLGGNWINENCR